MGKKRSVLPFTTAVEGFLAEKTIAQPSDHTLFAYKRDLYGVAARIAAHLKTTVEKLDVADLSRSAVVAGFASWSSDHAAASVRRAHSAWTGLFHWLILEEYLETSPMATIPRPKKTRHDTLRAVTPDDIERLIQVAADEDPTARHPWPLRDLALVVTFATTALRKGELTSLVVRDFNPRHEAISVVGKGGKVRTVPLPAETAQVISEYLESRLERFDTPFTDEDPLFVSAAGEKLRAYQIDYILTRLFDRAEVRVPGGGALAHSLRHAWARQAREAGIDVTSISAVLGHARLDTTQIYLGPADHAVAEAIELHPTARLVAAAR